MQQPWWCLSLFDVFSFSGCCGVALGGCSLVVLEASLNGSFDVSCTVILLHMFVIQKKKTT